MLKLSRSLLKNITPTALPEGLPKFRHIPVVPLVTKNEAADPDQITLHPDVFGQEHPDMRLLKQAVTWQETYKLVDMTHRVWRPENFGDSKKPWRLNTGRTRRRDQKSPMSILGTTKGNFSGPWSMWSEFPENKQVEALAAALTVKYAQGDLVIFDAQEVDPGFWEARYGQDTNYILTIVGDLTVPQKFVSDSKFFNSLPVTGLNVLSILNHDKLHIHISCVGKIQKRLLDWRTRYPLGQQEDFEESERHTFYTDSQHVEARPDWRRGDTVLDQVEADGKSYKYQDQNEFGSFFDGSDKHKEFIVRGD